MRKKRDISDLTFLDQFPRNGKKTRNILPYIAIAGLAALKLMCQLSPTMTSAEDKSVFLQHKSVPFVEYTVQIGDTFLELIQSELPVEMYTKPNQFSRTGSLEYLNTSSPDQRFGFLYRPLLNEGDVNPNIGYHCNALNPILAVNNSKHILLDVKSDYQINVGQKLFLPDFNQDGIINGKEARPTSYSLIHSGSVNTQGDVFKTQTVFDADEKNILFSYSYPNQ